MDPIPLVHSVTRQDYQTVLSSLMFSGSPAAVNLLSSVSI